MQTGFIFGQGTDISDPKELARRRAIVDAMMAQQAQQGAPRNLGEGIFSAGNSIANALTDRNLKRQEDKAREEAAGALPGIVDLLNMGGQSYGGASSPAVSAQPIARTPDTAGGIADDTMKALGKTPMGPYRDAIASIESAGSGDYSAIGPTNPRLGRALGRYQIMEANIGPWSREILGREVTPDEFLANPQIQDAIFDGKFGGYVEKFGPEGAAQAWFAGPGGVGKMDRQDVLGTSVADYTRKFSAALGGQPSGQPAQPNAGTRTFNPEIINQLAALSSNPYASEGQRQIAALLMQQQIQQMMPQDPMKALELERAQLENERLRNPQPDLTTAQREYAAAQAQGFQGTFLEYQTALAEARRSNTNVNVSTAAGVQPLGTKGDILIQDPDAPNGVRVIQAEGSPAAREAAAAAATADRRGGNRETESSIITTAAQRARQAANSRALGGIGGRVAAINPGSTNAELYRQVDVLRSQAQLGNLQAMREASPTGGALGSVTEKELQILADKSGALDPASPNFLRDLDDYERTLLRTIHGPEEGDRIFEATRDNGDGWTTINGVRVREKK
jgi:hypothetical protein